MAAPTRPQSRDVAVVTRAEAGGIAEIGSLAMDPRDLVGSLLDRWQMSLEQRIYREHHNRFASELAGRQALVRELEAELDRVRAEHAASIQALRLEQSAQLADRDRTLAERDRAIADRDRVLADRENQILALREAAARRRGWFSRR